jgi:alpha-L-fucosidase
MKWKHLPTVFAMAAFATTLTAAEPAVPAIPAAPQIDMTAKPDAVRAKEVADMKWGMFICWSFSTFSGVEWTRTPHGPDFFKATDCDTDQWCKTAKEAGMGYILFLTKHHDGFCLWDTKTTELKVTNSPLKRDVLAELRKSCDKYGIKLAIYFSEGDWTWPQVVDGKPCKGGSQPEIKKAQLKELLTNYGPIEYIWFDHAQGIGGLCHAETDKWVAQFQPNCLPGYNHGTPGGRIRLGEMGHPSALNDVSGSGYNKHAAGYKGYIAAEFTYPILPAHQGGAMWFYSLPKHDNLCLPAEKLYKDYLGAVKFGNIFSIDVGPNYQGKLREIDVKTLETVGKYIKGEVKLTLPVPVKAATASGIWDKDYAADKACDNDHGTRWGAPKDARSGWLEIDLGKPGKIASALIDEAGFDRIRKFEIQAKAGDAWTTIATGTTLGNGKKITFAQPAQAQVFRLNILEATEVPTIGEFQLFE